MTLDYAIYDVFTRTPLEGNPLAVVFGGGDLGGEKMQAIAGEFNLSETVFILDADDELHSASLRIFTPSIELPFAGHPTIGAAIAHGDRKAGDDGRHEAALYLFKEKIGSIRVAVMPRDNGVFAEFDLPQLPQGGPLEIDKADIAAALGLERHEIGFENHLISLQDAGNGFVMVPVADLGAAGRARLDAGRWLALFGAHAVAPPPFVYCRDTVFHDCAFHARVFAPHFGIEEDPATGSAVAAFAGAVVAFDEPVNGPTALIIEQGLEMGRPSRIRLEIEMEAGRMSAARIGGEAVCIATGKLVI